MLTKSGKIKIFDADNHIKIMNDTVAKWLGIDDVYFSNFKMTSSHSEDHHYFNMFLANPSPLLES